jgi:hypothetical protein
MSDRTYDIKLKCGCLISLDGGGGLVPCQYGCGCGKKGCEIDHICKSCKKQEELCRKTWDKYRKSKSYKEHENEIVRRNR